MCQGKMPMSVRSRYESMLDKQPEKMKEMISDKFMNLDAAFLDSFVDDLYQNIFG